MPTPNYRARVYEIQGEPKFPDKDCPFNKNGPGTAQGNHLLFLSNPRSETILKDAIERIGDPAVYGILVYDRAIARTASLHHNYDGLIETKDLSELLKMIERNPCVKGKTTEESGHWNAFLLDRESEPNSFNQLIDDLNLEAW
ncbi:hypothetical protein HOD75_00390 [archaeon]|jgi:hypothetical protein|nr:hypothetical protein [archaeon]MBT4241334.1 hypothetical protein [archaeon]MBT4418155.1 hypothetical protein [archaeon]